MSQYSTCKIVYYLLYQSNDVCISHASTPNEGYIFPWNFFSNEESSLYFFSQSGRNCIGARAGFTIQGCKNIILLSITEDSPASVVAGLLYVPIESSLSGSFIEVSFFFSSSFWICSVASEGTIVLFLLPIVFFLFSILLPAWSKGNKLAERNYLVE
ncbi:MAG: hypothetical protein UV64_C0007G0017 [Parcubacteria group bacterium GW2011_GWC1_43_11b]|nr:MAG: hypothetical protein UV64_C0007G0017 [Parcubacteria group bacterium GW2011_GWC1_43_11b]